MPTYKIIIYDDNPNVAKTIEFDALTAGAAFLRLERERCDRHAELWENGKLVADIVHDRSGVWQVVS